VPFLRLHAFQAVRALDERGHEVPVPVALRDEDVTQAGAYQLRRTSHPVQSCHRLVALDEHRLEFQRRDLIREGDMDRDGTDGGEARDGVGGRHQVRAITVLERARGAFAV
jgi:hypothetical protein